MHLGPGYYSECPLSHLFPLKLIDFLHIVLQETWVAAYFWSDPKKERNDAIGIGVYGNDHYISNTIVFSARIGVELSGAANILNGEEGNQYYCAAVPLFSGLQLSRIPMRTCWLLPS